MNAQKLKRVRQKRRQFHVRSRITGTPERPRLSVFRSSKHIYAQLIDDLTGTTLAAAASSGKGSAYGGNIAAAKAVGTKLAAAAKAKGISSAAFDRGGYRFHGRVQALAVAATEAGLKCCDPKNIRQPAPPAPKGEAKAEGKPKAEKKKGGDKPAKPEKTEKTEKAEK
jgi:large subunit ribosomal protein L18